jgi:tetratricopeptide (TPR) repeat protein
LPSWRDRLLPAVALILIGTAAYSSSLQGGFVYDDVPSILENPDVREPDRFPRGEFRRPTRVVAYASFAVNHAIHGVDPLGYRLTNLGIHLANGLLVFSLCLLAFRTPRLRNSRVAHLAVPIAFLAATLFVSHPIQTQAVAYIVQRITSLATFFFLLASNLYLRFRLSVGQPGHRAHRVVTYVGALLASLLAMYTKEITFTLPVVLALADVTLFGPGPWKRFRSLLPFAATMLVIPITVIRVASPRGGADLIVTAAGATHVQTAMSRMDYLATEAVVVVRYLGLLLVPVGQNADPDVALARSFLEPAVLAAVLVLTAIAAGAALLFVRSRERRADSAGALVAFGVAWFFVTLSVESSVIPIVDVMNEHRVYLPSAGLALAAATLLGLLLDRLASRRAAAAVLVSAVVLGTALGIATWIRGTVWSSELALWSDTAPRSPRKARPLTNLGAALTEAGSLQEAERVLRVAVETNPSHADAWFNLGNVYLRQPARYDEASRCFARALELAPEHVGARSNLTAVLLQQRRFLDVIVLLDARPKGTGIAPEALFNLGVALAATGNLAAAQRQADVLAPVSPGLASRLRAYLSATGVALPAGQE